MWASITASLDWFVGAVGSLGTFVVAWLVYRAGKQQHRDARANEERQYRLEEQAFRLALLERRSAVVRDFAEIVAALNLGAREDQDIFKKLDSVFLEAELIYGDGLLEALGPAITLSRNAHSVRTRRDIALKQGGSLATGEKADDLTREFLDLWGRLLPQLIDLQARLKLASRVEEPNSPDRIWQENERLRKSGMKAISADGGSNVPDAS